MVNIKNIKRKKKIFVDKKLCSILLNESWIKKLKDEGITFADFVREAFKETFPDIEKE